MANISDYQTRLAALLEELNQDSDIGAHELRDFYAESGRQFIAASVEIANIFDG